MIEDNSASMAMLQRLFNLIDTAYTEDVLEPSYQQIEAVSPSTSSQASVRSRSSGRTFQKAKRRKLGANTFVDIAAVEDDEQEDTEEESEELVHRPQAVGPSGKLSFQQRIDAIINRLDCGTPEQVTFGRPEVSQILEGIVLPSEKSIFVVDFFSGTCYKFIFVVLFSYIMYSWCQNIFLRIHEVQRVSGDNTALASSPTIRRGF